MTDLSTKSRVRAAAADISDADAFDLLDDSTKIDLMEKFIADQDASDLFAAWERSMNAASTSERLVGVSEYCERVWSDWLRQRDLALNYHAQIEAQLFLDE